LRISAADTDCRQRGSSTLKCFDPGRSARRARHDGPGSEERTVWKVTAIIEATADQAEAAQQTIARAVCPDENHPGYCPNPWTMVACRFEDMPEDERAAWQADFDEERERAREAGEPGA
jgi:hypothetical protein